MQQQTSFRRWVGEIYRENCEEHLIYNESIYTMKQYWDRYKWWLKREYRYKHNEK